VTCQIDGDPHGEFTDCTKENRNSSSVSAKRKSAVLGLVWAEHKRVPLHSAPVCRMTRVPRNK